MAGRLVAAPRRPTLANACAAAATAAEARYRIGRPIAETRRTAVVALDEPAVAVLQRAVPTCSDRVRFFRLAAPPAGATNGNGDRQPGLALVDLSGGRVPVGEAVADADLVVLVAAGGEVAAAAGAVGEACRARGVMTAGVVVGPAARTRAVVSALRPHAAMLLVSSQPDDLGDILGDLRA